MSHSHVLVNLGREADLIKRIAPYSAALAQRAGDAEPTSLGDLGSPFTAAIIEAQLGELLAPYDENTQVEPYRDYWPISEKGSWSRMMVEVERAPRAAYSFASASEAIVASGVSAKEKRQLAAEAAAFFAAQPRGFGDFKVPMGSHEPDQCLPPRPVIITAVKPETTHQEMRDRWAGKKMPDGAWEALCDEWNVYRAAEDAAWAAAYTDEEVAAVYNRRYRTGGDGDDEKLIDHGEPPAGSMFRRQPIFGDIPDRTDIYDMSQYNPRSRWDFWTLGGRWSGYWSVRFGASASLGKPGDGALATALDKAAVNLYGTGADAPDRALANLAESWKPGTALQLETGRMLAEREASLLRSGKADVARKADIDFDAMRAAAAVDFGAVYDAALQRPEWPIDWDEPEKVGDITRDEYVAKRMAEYTPATYAILDPSEGWFERGRMGWFGVTLDEKMGTAEWQQRWQQYVDGLPDDSLLAICDLHI